MKNTNSNPLNPFFIMITALCCTAILSIIEYQRQHPPNREAKIPVYYYSEENMSSLKSLDYANGFNDALMEVQMEVVKLRKSGKQGSTSWTDFAAVIRKRRGIPEPLYTVKEVHPPARISDD